MAIGVTLFSDGEIPEKPPRHKGHNLLSFPDEYVVLDIETTGLSPDYDDIIELTAIKISGKQAIDVFSSLVKPKGVYIDDDGSEYYVDDFITKLTGITNKMLETAPTFYTIVTDFLEFVGDSIILGHNVNFDINFIYDNVLYCTGKEFNNDYCDLMRISRRLFPDFSNHKLSTLAKEFDIEQESAHRGYEDCKTTVLCFEHCREYVAEHNIDLSIYKNGLNLSKFHSDKLEFDETHPLYGKYCVFTGTLEKMKRAEAAQLVVDLGGICENGVTKKTNYLILGNNDYCKTIKDGKSSKQKKAEKLILEGQDLSIMPEDVFYDMVQVLSLEDAKKVVIKSEKSENAAFLFNEGVEWYISPCSSDEIETLENSNGDVIPECGVMYCFNQFTGKYKKIELK